MIASVKTTTVDQVVERLVTRFPKAVRSHITGIVGVEYDLLSASPIRIYIPNLVEHASRAQLRRERDAAPAAA